MNRYRLVSTCLAFLALLCLPALAQRGRGPARAATAVKPDPAVAIVNGQRIPMARYLELYADQLSYQQKIGSGPVVDQATEDALFLQLIEEELVRQEAARRKIVVTRNQALKALLANPPDFMREPFIDDKNVFREDIFRQVVEHPELMARLAGNGANPDTVVARWRADVEKVILYVRGQETLRLIKEALTREKPLSPADIRHRYFAERTKFNGSFIRVLHSTIPDSLVPVTEQEARAWYDSHLEDYRFASARQLAAFILPVVPLAEDSAAQRTRIAAVRDTVMNAAPELRPQTIARLLQTLPPNRFPARPLSLALVPDMARETLRNARPNELVGPFKIDEEDVLLFIDDTARTGDTVLRARHVLVKVPEGDTAEDRATYDLLVMLREKIVTEDLFLQAVQFYSQDGTKNRGGDLGYFGRGGMVRQFEEAAFNATPGQCIGPIRTPFGYHLIWVKERITTGFQVRELRFPFAPSQKAAEAAQRDATQFAAALRDGSATDSLFFEIKARYPRSLTDTSLLRRLDIYGDALAPANFGFSSEPGDVAALALPYNRVMVAKVLYSYPSGIAPYDKIRSNFVYTHVRRAKQLDMLAPTMKELKDTMTADMMLGIIRLKAPWAESFMHQNQFLTSPPDEDTTLLDSLVERTPDGGVSGPVRGTHGYYFLRVINKVAAPTAADFARDRVSFTRDYTDRYQQRLFKKMLQRLRDYADVQDLRGTGP